MLGTDLLLHITTAAPWRVALEAGSLVTPSLVTPPSGAGGFIHLSRPEQVALPANRLYAGRDDLLLLVIDPARLPAEVRWEPGVPGDPESMRFPHLYGPLPVAAVTSVVPWRPGPDGSFTGPEGLPHPGDATARAVAFERSLAVRRSPVVVELDGGVAMLDPRVPASYEHNGVWLDRPLGADAIRGLADGALAGCTHRRVVSDVALPDDLGWDLDVLRLLVLGPDGPIPSEGAPVGDHAPVVRVTAEAMAATWATAWCREIPGIDAAAVDDLVRREAFADAHLRLVHLAVPGPDGAPVAGLQLRIDGATAAIEHVGTEPEARRRGHATALVAAAVARARAAGCDVVWLAADAHDWPLGWYERLGFAPVADRWLGTLREAGYATDGPLTST